MAMDSGEQTGASRKVAVEEEPFPAKQLTILAICRFSEPIAFNSILAYTYVMVLDLHDGDDTNASFYAGLLVSAFAVAEAMTAMLWGSLSDRYGRKPIALFGLIGVAISSLIFGLAKNYWVAFLARFVGGALNGNVAVMQTMVAEMVKNPAHEPKAYAVQPFVWTLGSIIGSAMGGFLAQPAVFYPSIFPQDGLFGRYPYLLPNLVAVAVLLLAVIQGIFFLEETNPLFLLAGQQQAEQTATEDPGERAPLLGSPSHQRADRPQEISPRPIFLEESLPTSTTQTFDLRRSSFGTIHSVRLAQDQLVAEGPQDDHLREQPRPEENPSPAQRALNFPVVMLTTTLVLIAFHQMAFGAILPIYLLDLPSSPAPAGGGHLDLYGGFGLTVHDVGTYLALSGVIALLVQAVVFPFFVERVGVWYSFLVTVLLYPVAYVVMPFLTMLLGTDFLPLGIYLTMLLQAFFGIISGPCILILLKNAAPSPLVLGKVNGFAMSATCAARTVSPPLVGFIYSQGGSAAAWFSCAVVAVLGSFQLWLVPREEASVGKVNTESPFKAVNHSSEESHLNGVTDESAVIDEHD